MADPLVTVYIPVYNGAQFVQEAIDSIATQTFTDWECILVDDCSTDESSAILAAVQDPRFRVVRQPTNLNVANASNLAMRLASGKYLARLDQDDVAAPERLAMQFEFMEAHPEIAVCGTAMKMFGDMEAVNLPPADDGQIKMKLLAAVNTIQNPTSFLRTGFFREHSILSDPRFPVSCDYVMWVHCAIAGGGFANLQPFLTRYRIHGAQGSNNRKEMMRGVVHAKIELLHAWYPDLTHDQVVAVEPIVRVNDVVVLSPEKAKAGVEICRSMMDPSRHSVCGEDRLAIRQFLQSRCDEWEGHLPP